MQAASDIFLGWVRVPPGVEDLRLHDLDLRQLWDSKTSFEVTRMHASDLEIYGRLCAWTLARAHARSGDAIAIASYLGSSDSFDRAIATFSEAYADQNERDHTALVNAIAAGRIAARQDL